MMKLYLKEEKRDPLDLSSNVMDFYFAMVSTGLYRTNELPEAANNIYHVFSLESNAHTNGFEGYIQNSEWDLEDIDATKHALKTIKALRTYEIFSKIDDQMRALGNRLQAYFDGDDHEAIDIVFDKYVSDFYDALEEDDTPNLYQAYLNSLDYVVYLKEAEWDAKMEELREQVPDKMARLAERDQEKAEAQADYVNLASTACTHLEENLIELTSIWHDNADDLDTLKVHFITNEGKRYYKFDPDTEDIIMEVYDDNDDKKSLLLKLQFDEAD